MAEIRVKLYHPSELSEADWYELQGMERSAYRKVLDPRRVSQQAIDAFVDWGNVTRFQQSHVDSSSERGKRFSANQVWANGRIAIATKYAGAFPQRVGFGSAYWNASYGPPEGPQDDSLKAQTVRAAKMGSVVVPPPFSAKANKSYLALREVVTDPDHMERGIARQVLGTLLRPPTAIPWQHVTFYDWPEIDPEWMRPTLQEYGLSPKGGGSLVQVFGEIDPPVWQDRLEAPSASGILQHIREHTQTHHSS